MLEEWDRIKNLYNEFIKFNPRSIGEGLNYSSIRNWMSDRKHAYRKYSVKLNPNNKSLKSLCNNYKEWCKASNNKSWTNLTRRGYWATETPERLSNLLSLLLDEDIEIEERVQLGLRERFKVDGIGEGILTGLLHTFFPDKYGVWNKRTIEGLRTLGYQLYGLNSRYVGKTYRRINGTLTELSEVFQTDLTHIDAFMWYLSKHR